MTDEILKILRGAFAAGSICMPEGVSPTHTGDDVTFSERLSDTTNPDLGVSLWGGG